MGGLGGRRLERARELAERLARDGGEPDAGLRDLLDDLPSRVASYAAAALVLGVLALMVFKP